MEHYQEVIVALSESVIQLAIKPRYLGSHALQIKVTMDHHQEVMLALSESVMNNHLKRP